MVIECQSLGPPISEKVIDIRNFGAKVDGVTDDRQAILDAIDSAEGDRRLICIPEGEGAVSSSEIDLQATSLMGHGIDQASARGGSTLTFLEGGLYSSVPTSRGFSIEDLYIQGNKEESQAATDTGQILVDYSGQNYPYMSNVRIAKGDEALRLQEGANPAFECHYGRFFGIDLERCNILLNMPDSIRNGGHAFYGGRWWRAYENGFAAYIGVGVNNVSFNSIWFESGSTTWNIADVIRSYGSSIDVSYPRMETVSLPGSTPIGLHVMPGAGRHRIWGGSWSSGFHLHDENVGLTPGVSGVTEVYSEIKHFNSNVPNVRYGIMARQREITLVRDNGIEHFLTVSNTGQLLFDGVPV